MVAREERASLRRAALISFLIILVAQATYALVRGVHLGRDSAEYSRWADALLAANFDFGEMSRQATTTYPTALYRAWITVVAVCKMIGGPRWTTLLVALNVVASAVTGTAVATLVFRLSRSLTVSAVAVAFFAGAFEILDWSRYVLSDSTFTCLAFGAFALVAWSMLGGSRLALVAGCLSLLVSAIYRPTSVPVVLVVGTMAIVAAARDRASRVLARPYTLPAFLGAAACVAAVGVATFARVMQHPALWPFTTGRELIDLTASHFQMGEVVWDRPSTFHPPPASYLDYLGLAVDRIAHFFYFVSSAFSASHNIAGLVFFVPAYALAAMGVIFALRGSLRSEERIVVAFSFLVVLATDVFHGLVQVDYDWRYRLPILPHIVLLAGVGVSALLARAKPLGRPAHAAQPLAQNVGHVLGGVPVAER